MRRRARLSFLRLTPALVSIASRRTRAKTAREDAPCGVREARPCDVDAARRYHAQTVPILAHYEPSGVVSMVDANTDIDKVWEQIDSVISVSP